MSIKLFRGNQLLVETTMVTETCCACGMLFAMTVIFKNDRLKRTRGDMTFYCPRGHPQHYTGPSEADKLRQERDRLKQNEAYLEDRLRAARRDVEHQKHRANGYKGHATRITKRVKAGVCPCCNRTFKALAEHMARQHPDFTPIEVGQSASATP